MNVVTDWRSFGFLETYCMNSNTLHDYFTNRQKYRGHSHVISMAGYWSSVCRHNLDKRLSTIGHK